MKDDIYSKNAIYKFLRPSYNKLIISKGIIGGNLFPKKDINIEKSKITFPDNLIKKESKKNININYKMDYVKDSYEFSFDGLIPRINSISSGRYHNLVLLDNGKVLSWGHNEKGSLGQGTVTNSEISLPTKIKESNNKNYLGNNDTSGYDGTNAISVSCGHEHSAILLNTGKVITFGNNTYGQLGHGKSDDYSSGDPSGVKDSNLKDSNGVVDLSSYNGSNAVAVSCGGWHTLILLNNGKVISFGWNSKGNLGQGNNLVSSQPDPSGILMNAGYDGTNAIAVSGGGYFSLVLLKSGKVISFGRNDKGDLGNGQIINTNYGIPQSVLEINGYDGTNVVQVECGYDHGGILLKSGKVLMFGLNESGQLGRGNLDNSGNPEEILKVVGYNGINCVSIFCGSYHSLILLDNGKVISFGWSDNKQLGHDVATANVSTPVEVKYGSSYNKNNCVLCSCTWSHTLLLLDNGKILSFGKNNESQLGLGNSNNGNFGTLQSIISTTDYTGNNILTIGKNIINTNFNLDKKINFIFKNNFENFTTNMQLNNYVRYFTFDNKNINITTSLPMLNSTFKAIELIK